MTNLLIKLFVKNSENTTDPKVRENYGTLSGLVGIFVNVILSAFKFIFGSITASIAITADGMNNLFDAVSSVISLVGFKISGKPADKDHPFGHGRIEYVAALVLAFLIGHTGIDLIKESIAKFSEKSQITFTYAAVVVLVASILMKIWLAVFNSKVGKKIDSVTVDAVVKDSIGDIAATTCSLIALFASRFTSLPLDAVMGLIVSLVIIYAAFDIIKSTLGPLLGEPPEKEVVDELEKLVMSYDGIYGIHDMVLHAYGTSKVMGSLHAEVSADVPVMESHDLIDTIEFEIKKRMNMEITIHLDPILVNDERTDTLKAKMLDIVKSISEEITIHDFRVVDGPTHTNLIFDAVLPFKFRLTDEEFREAVGDALSKEEKACFAVINIDRNYAG